MIFLYARVVELVDTRDLKSLEGDFVPVQVRPRVPLKTLLQTLKLDFLLKIIDLLKEDFLENL